MYSQQIVEWGEPLEGRDLPTPEPEGTEVLVRVTACGVCHSDIHIWDGGFDLGGGKRLTLAERGVTLPFTMGHEVVGEVVALGPEAEGVEVGEPRIVFPWIGCGECAVCAQGDELLCLAPRTVGTRRPGGYSDHVVVPHPRFLIDYAGIPTDLACTYACSGVTAFSALKKVDFLAQSDHLVIVGAGGVGLNGVHFAPAVVKAKVILADLDGAKRAAARQAGVAETIDNSEPDAVARVLEMTGGGAAAAIDFVGAPATGGFAFNVLRKGGTQISVGLYGDAMPLSLALLPLKMATIRGSYVGSLAEMHEMMELVRGGKVAPIPLELRPLSEATAALTDLRAGRVMGRVVLKP